MAEWRIKGFEIIPNLKRLEVIEPALKSFETSPDCLQLLPDNDESLGATWSNLLATSRSGKVEEVRGSFPG